MNEVAQSALLKTLEEPPAGDDPDPVRRRRGGPPARRSARAAPACGWARSGSRAIEGLLADLELADPPTAARLARLAGGRPGLAVAYARSPEAERLRGELVRTLLDLLGRSRAERLGVRAGPPRRPRCPWPRGWTPMPPAAADAPRRRGRASAAGRAGLRPPRPADSPPGAGEARRAGSRRRGRRHGREGLGRRPAPGPRACSSTCGAASPATSRWSPRGATGSVRDVALLEDLERAAASLPAGRGRRGRATASSAPASCSR